ncbi:MAG: glycosyltransferase [Pseudonocardiaceae bacterium]
MKFTTSPPTGEVVFVFGSIAMKRGGVTRTILARMRLYAQSGIPVRLLLTGQGFREDAEEAAIRKAWSLPDSVEIRYFWREAAPGGGGAPVDPLVTAEDEPEFTTFPEPVGKSSKVIRFYSDGLLVKTKHFDPRGRIKRIEHHDAARRTVSQQHFDTSGRLVRTDGLDLETGNPTLCRWFDRSGSCWLTTWPNQEDHSTVSVRHRPDAVAYDHFGQCVAEWVDEVLADSECPMLFSDTRNHDQVALAMKHPNVRRIAVLHNCHTARPYRAHDHLKGNYEHLLANLDAFDSVVVLTHRQQRDIERRFGATNLTVINHPTPPSPDLRVPRTPGLLVAVSRLAPQKRLEHAIRAFALAAPKVPHARFDIYGTGPEAGTLKALVAKLGVGDLVQFRGFTQQALAKFAGATATVLSSWFEGFPLVLNEAMGVGTPFVAYDISYGPAEVIRHEVDGLLVPWDDIDALAKAMVRVLGDPAYAAKLSERARDVTERFSEERWAREWSELFAKLATGQP